MPFDPQAYIGEEAPSSGFDPKAYLEGGESVAQGEPLAPERSFSFSSDLKRSRRALGEQARKGLIDESPLMAMDDFEREFKAAANGATLTNPGTGDQIVKTGEDTYTSPSYKGPSISSEDAITDAVVTSLLPGGAGMKAAGWAAKALANSSKAKRFTGTILGGIGGAFGAGYAQNKAIEAVNPDKARELEIAQKERLPETILGNALGGNAPYQRIAPVIGTTLKSELLGRGIGAGIGGAIEAIRGGSPGEIGAQTAIGALFNDPTKLGAKIFKGRSITPKLGNASTKATITENMAAANEIALDQGPKGELDNLTFKGPQGEQLAGLKMLEPQPRIDQIESPADQLLAYEAERQQPHMPRAEPLKPLKVKPKRATLPVEATSVKDELVAAEEISAAKKRAVEAARVAEIEAANAAEIERQFGPILDAKRVPQPTKKTVGENLEGMGEVTPKAPMQFAEPTQKPVEVQSQEQLNFNNRVRSVQTNLANEGVEIDRQTAVKLARLTNPEEFNQARGQLIRSVRGNNEIPARGPIKSAQELDSGAFPQSEGAGTRPKGEADADVSRATIEPPTVAERAEVFTDPNAKPVPRAKAFELTPEEKSIVDHPDVPVEVKAEVVKKAAKPMVKAVEKVDIGPREPDSGTGAPNAREQAMLAEQKRLVNEHLAAQKAAKEAVPAVSKPSEPVVAPEPTPEAPKPVKAKETPETDVAERTSVKAGDQNVTIWKSKGDGNWRDASGNVLSGGSRQVAIEKVKQMAKAAKAPASPKPLPEPVPAKAPEVKLPEPVPEATVTPAPRSEDPKLASINKGISETERLGGQWMLKKGSVIKLAEKLESEGVLSRRDVEDLSKNKLNPEETNKALNSLLTKKRNAIAKPVEKLTDHQNADIIRRRAEELKKKNAPAPEKAPEPTPEPQPQAEVPSKGTQYQLTVMEMGGKRALQVDKIVDGKSAGSESMGDFAARGMMGDAPPGKPLPEGKYLYDPETKSFPASPKNPKGISGGKMTSESGSVLNPFNRKAKPAPTEEPESFFDLGKKAEAPEPAPKPKTPPPSDNYVTPDDLNDTQKLYEKLKKMASADNLPPKTDEEARSISRVVDDGPEEFRAGLTDLASRFPTMFGGWGPGRAASAVAGGFAKAGKKVLGTIVGNIREHSPELVGAIREKAKELNDMRLSFTSRADELGLQARKTLTRDEFNELDKANLSGDRQAAMDLFRGKENSKELIEAYDKHQEVMQEALAMERELGRDVGEVDTYFRRQVIDRDGLIKALGGDGEDRYRDLIKQAKDAKGKPLTAADEERVLNNLVQGSMRNPGGPGYLKARTVERITDNLLNFYEPFDVSTHNYLMSVTRDISNRRWFGKTEGHVINKEGGTLVAEPDFEASNFGRILRDNNLKGKGYDTVVQNLQDYFAHHSRFDQELTGAANAVRKFQTYAYLADVGSAIIQASEAFNLALKYGVGNTAKGVKDFKKFDLSDIGVFEGGNQDIVRKNSGRSVGPLAVPKSIVKGVEAAYSKSMKKLIQGADEIMTGAAASSAYHWVNKVVNNEGSKAFAALDDKYSKMFPDKWDSILKDLKSDDFKKGKLNENTSLFLFTEVASLKPIDAADKAQLYNSTNPWGKLIYTLRTYPIKQLDVMRENVYEEAKRGNVGQAIRNGAAYAVVVGMGQQSMNYLRDKLFDRESDPSEYITSGVLQLVMIPRYAITKAKQDSLPEAAISTALPGLGAAIDFSKDAMLVSRALSGQRDSEGRRTVESFEDFFKQARTSQYLPAIGRPVYWWAGRGSEQQNRQERDRLEGKKQKGTLELMGEFFNPSDLKTPRRD